jgi:hypothetical protein
MFSFGSPVKNCFPARLLSAANVVCTDFDLLKSFLSAVLYNNYGIFQLIKY